MSNIKLLDCTLRDGGYINNWNFGEEEIRDILFNLAKSGTDIIECGFLSDKLYDHDRSIFSSPEQIDALLPETDCMYVGMIAIGEKEIHPDLLPNASSCRLSGIRLTFHSDEIDKALEYGQIIKRKGYRLFLQPVGSSFYSDDKLLSLMLRANEIEPYAFYIVDTLGCMYPRDLQRQLYLADYNLKPGIRIGFHSHNNLQMAFANAQHMIEYKTERTRIIDCSVNGMGRGAGNLCSELIMDYLNRDSSTDYDVVPLLELSDKYLSSIYVSNPWGYSSAYYLSAISRCHPNYSSYLISKQTLSGGSIREILDQIPVERRKRFDGALIKQLYQTFQKNAVDDTETVDYLRRLFDGREILVIAPGKTVETQLERIHEYIRVHRPFVISINFVPQFLDADLCFVTSSKRLEMLPSGSCPQLLLTSNLKSDDTNTWVVNYASLTNTSVYASDSAGTMLLKLLVKCSVRRAALAGFDGFEVGTQNYFDSRYEAYIEKQAIETKNAEIMEQLMKRAEELELTFITDSKYAQPVLRSGKDNKI